MFDIISNRTHSFFCLSSSTRVPHLPSQDSFFSPNNFQKELTPYKKLSNPCMPHSTIFITSSLLRFLHSVFLELFELKLKGFSKVLSQNRVITLKMRSNPYSWAHHFFINFLSRSSFHVDETNECSSIPGYGFLVSFVRRCAETFLLFGLSGNARRGITW